MTVVRGTLQWVGALGGLGLVAIAVVGLASGGGVLDVAILVLGVVVIAFWVRPALLVGPDEVVVRPLVSSRRIDRADIVAADALPIQGWGSWRQLVLQLADGSLVVVHRLGQRGEGGAVDRARELLAD